MDTKEEEIDMSEGHREEFPSLEAASEYLVPGPGMGMVQPWTLTESRPPQAPSSPENDIDSPPAPPTEATDVQVEREAPAEDHRVEEHRVEEHRVSEPPASPNGWGIEDAGPSSWDSALPPFLQQELAPILESAQQAAAQIIDRARAQARQEAVELERARARARDEIAEVDRVRNQMEQRVADLMSWNEQVEPTVHALRARMDEIRARVDELPELIRKGLDPLASTVSSLDPALDEMAAVSGRLLSLSPVKRRAGSETQAE